MEELEKLEIPAIKVWDSQRVVTFNDIDRVYHGGCIVLSRIKGSGRNYHTDTHE